MVQDNITAGIPYTVDTGEKLLNESFGPNNIRRRNLGTQELKQVAVHDGRLLADRLSLDGQGSYSSSTTLKSRTSSTPRS